MNAHQTEVTPAEVKMMFEVARLYAGMHGCMARAPDALQFFGPEEWLNHCREYNEPECPEEWAGDTGNTDPSILVMPSGTIMDEECPEAMTWGVYRNAGIDRAADFIVAMPSFNIPHALHTKVAELAKQMVA